MNTKPTKLEASFLQAVVLIGSFKHDSFVRVKAALLVFALRLEDFTAAQLPKDLTGDNKHIAGAACGALVAEGLITVCGRVKSPDPKAKGRKTNLFRLSEGRRETVLAWFRANEMDVPELKMRQQELVGA